MQDYTSEAQIDMLSVLEKDPFDNPCCVIQNNKCMDATWRELFDAHKYDTLKCVTYVSSAGFFAKSVGKFKQVGIIIGIEKGEVKQAFADSMRARISGDGTKFFEELPDEGKKRMIEGDVVIRYSKADCIIHSKIYLLSNSQTEDNRIIIGSANLTNTAFDNAVKQYEDVMVFDNNNALFSIYNKRYEAIYAHTQDYVPQDVRDRYVTGKVVSIADFTPEEKTEELIELFERENIVPVCTETMMKYVQEAQAETDKSQTEVKTSFEVISVVSKMPKNSTVPVLKTKAEMVATKTKIIDILFHTTKKENELARFTLTYNDADKHQYVVYPKKQDELVPRQPEMYDRQATSEEVKGALLNLDSFITAYQKFVHTADSTGENLSHIFEIMLYAFTAAYIFRVRQTTSGSKADIPIMLVIGGRPASGKSNMLAYIDRVLSGRQLPLERHYIQYKNIEKGGTIPGLFQTDNTYPLLVDEVAPSFFSSKYSGKGEELIKYLSNTLSGRHPVMICTTNTGAFSIPAQVARRIYYLQVDSSFDEELKAQANEYYENVMANANNILFRDFCNRMSLAISGNESLFDEGNVDYLHMARQIFAQYYAETGMEKPKYFSESLYHDYTARGQNLWRTLFLQKQESFSYNDNEKNGEAVLTINLKTIASVTRDNLVYMNYLRPDLLVEEAGVFTVLRAEAFCEWIGVKNPWRKKTLLEKLFGK